jgi:hypothetical protein
VHSNSIGTPLIRIENTIAGGVGAVALIFDFFRKGS